MGRVNDNVLYVMSEGAFVHQEGLCVCVRVEDKQRIRVPWSQLAGVAVFGRTYVTPELMHALMKDGVWLSYLSKDGRFLARVQGPPTGNVVLRDAQHHAANNEEMAAKIVKSIVLGKLANQRRYLRRSARENTTQVAKRSLADAADALKRIAKTASLKKEINQLRGFEGAGAQAYFAAFDDLLHVNAEWARFSKRSRRPPKNAVNAMLSFGYALLCADCSGALSAVGLEPGIGFLHVLRSGRPALALDLMEEFRVVFVDRLVVAMINRGQLKRKDFHQDEGGAVSMSDDGRKAFLVAYQEAKTKRLKHPFLRQETRFSKLPMQQARLLARTLRGDLEDYPPFALEG